jgi:hypothetical protein
MVHAPYMPIVSSVAALDHFGFQFFLRDFFPVCVRSFISSRSFDALCNRLEKFPSARGGSSNQERRGRGGKGSAHQIGTLDDIQLHEIADQKAVE